MKPRNPDSFIQEDEKGLIPSSEKWFSLADSKTLSKIKVERNLELENCVYRQVGRRILNRQDKRHKKEHQEPAI